MTFSVTVMGHGAVQATFDRHVPLWRALNSQVNIVISPQNDALKTKAWPGVVPKCLGQAQRHGPDSVTRFLWIFKTLARIPCSHHLIFEYDSVSLSPVIPEQAGLSGILGVNTEPWRYIAPRYPHPPWLIDHASLLDLQRVALRYPDVTEEGWADRFLAAWAHLAGVPILSYRPPGYSDDSMEVTDAMKMHNLEHTILRGGRMFHGFKDAEVLYAAQRLAL
jgi:hypothetical protein